MTVILQFRDPRGAHHSPRAKPPAKTPGEDAEVVIFPGIRIERDSAGTIRDEVAKPRSVGGTDD